LRFAIGALCLAPFALAARVRPAPRDIVPVALLGILFFAAFPWFFNKALSLTSAAHGALALSALPLATLGLAAALGVERASVPKLGGVALAILGVATALGADARAGGAWRGDLVMGGAVLCGGAYNVLARPYLRRYPALVFTFWGMVVGALASGALGWAEGGHLPATALGWWGAVFLGTAGAALTFFLWSLGLERTTPTRVAITVAINPVVAIGLGPVLLGEPFSPGLGIGLAAVVGGILLASIGAEAAGPRPRPSLCSRQNAPKNAPKNA
jgi:drug/metabolite transporter (DMT)-like permease